MKSFKDGQRITVTAEAHPLLGQSGSVKRLRMADDGAWVKFDNRIPADWPFPEGDTRSNDAVIYPEECVPASPPAPATSGSAEGK